jgi:hypothetical protein
MTRAIWSHELRRVGWVGLFAPPAAIALAAVFSVLAQTLHMAGQVDKIQRGAISFLWLGAGLAAAALTGTDAALELHLSLPGRFAVTVGRRLVLAMCWSAVVSAALVAYLVGTGRDLGLGEWNMDLQWLAPSAFLAGLGSAARALTGSTGAAAGLVGIVWIFFSALPNSVAHLWWVQPWLLDYPVDLANPAGYLANRALLAGLAGVGFAIALWRLRRPEVLLGEEA